MTRALWLLLLVSLGLSLAALAWADGTCPPVWEAEYGGHTYTGGSPSDVAGQVISAHNSSVDTMGISYETWTLGSCDSVSGSCTKTTTINAGAAAPTLCMDNPDACSTSGPDAFLTATSHIPDSCESNPCTAKAGMKKSLWTYPGESSSDQIQTSDGCAAKVKSRVCYGDDGSGLGAYCVSTYEYTGDEADSGDDPEAGTAGDCASGPKGTLCVKPDKPPNGDCYSLNGETVCFEIPPSPPSGCAATASGGVVCFEDAPVQPDNGTPGMPAVPAAQVSTPKVGGGTNNYNWYSASQVSNSSVSVITNGSGGGGSGGSLDDLEEPDLGDAPSFGESLATYWDAVKAAPIVAALDGLGASLPAGACPSWSTTVSAYGRAFDIDFAGMCTLWDSISSVVSAVMLVGWAFLGIKIVMSA